MAAMNVLQKNMGILFLLLSVSKTLVKLSERAFVCSNYCVIYFAFFLFLFYSIVNKKCIQLWIMQTAVKSD